MDESYINGFSPKNLVWSKWVIWGLKMIHLHDSDLLQGFFLFGSIKGVKRYKKIILIILVKSSGSNRLLWAHKSNIPAMQWLTHWCIQSFLGRPVHTLNPQRCYHGCLRVSNSSKFVPDALKMTSLTLSVLRFLCETFHFYD